MKISWITQEKTKLEFELIGEDHTFCNAIRRELWQHNDLNLAAYKIAHPLASEPTIVIATNKQDALKVLNSSIESLKKKSKAIKDAFSKAVK